MINYRLANVSDAAELKRLNDAFNGDGCSSVEGIAISLKSNTNEIVCVAADGDKLAGFCCGLEISSMCYPNKSGEVTELFVAEEYRRQGIGRRLINEMENELAKRDVVNLCILTGDDNIKAQSLYLSCGYEDAEEMVLEKDLLMF